MKLSGNTILITGGSSGIGLELSRQLIARKNKVVICGRSNDKLLRAQKQHPELSIYPCDLSDEKQRQDLVHWITQAHPAVNVLINNAAIVHKDCFLEMEDAVEKAETEMQTNFLAPLSLIKLLFPVIRENYNPVIINITTGLIYAPRADYPFYNATKAGLHAFTQVLRKQTEGTGVTIIETMFPAVETPWHRGNPPKIAISPEQAVREMLTGLQKNKPEIRVAGAKLLYAVSRLAPTFAFNKVNSLNNS